jgi:hypothetical protein
MAGNTFTWIGGSGNWFDPTHWSASGAPTTVPASGASIIINSGTISLNGTDEITNVPTFGNELTPLLGESISLGSTDPSAPAAIVATSALFGRYVTITSAGTNADALLTAIGPTGFTGAIIADASGGTFDINATQADGGQPADLVLLTDSSVVVEGGDNLLLNGLLTAEASYTTIAAGGTLTNDGTIRMFAGGGTLSAGSTITGTGTFVVNPDTTLYDETAIPATQTVAIDGAGRLDIGTLSAFAGQIINLGLGGTIDLLNTIANQASYNAGTGTLTIENNGSVIGTLNVQGPASGPLTTASDTAGGTVITVPGSASRVSYEITTGAQALGANIVQATMKTVTGAPITGTGIKIGIMSDSFNATVNGVVDPADTAAQLGYLPETSSGTSAVTVLQDSNAPGVENEGLAMAELVHQVAPGAQIYFYSAVGTQDDFANGVNALVNAGVNIIVDDWSNSATPFFQVAGPIDTAVQNAISAGVDYFTAASNDGAAYFQAAWQPTIAQLVVQAGNPAQTVSAQLFDNGTVFQTITVPGSLDTSLDLQWNAAWPSQNGSSVPDSLGMALYNMSGTLVASSYQVSDPADGYGDLPEIDLTVPESATATNYQLAIYQIAGEPTVSQFKYIAFGSPAAAQDPGAVIDDPNAGIGSGSVHGWELIPGVNTVGAAYWANSPAYNVASNWTEWFSSTGPGQLLFNQTGTALSPSVLAGKVDFVAPDGIETSVPGFQGFYGTSAAAPDAAAVAALMLQADPELTTAQVTSMLEQSAVSMSLPAADQGAGLIQAPGAVQLALDAYDVPRTLQWTAAADTNFANAANWNDLTDALNPASLAPDSADTAILAAGAGTITGTDTIAALDVNGAGNWTLGADLATGSVDVGDMGDDDGTGGSLTVDGSLIASANITVTQTGTDAAVMTVGSLGVVSVAGTLSVSGNGPSNSGTVTVDSGGTLSADNIVVGNAGDGGTGTGTLTVESGGLLNQTNGVFQIGADFAGGGIGGSGAVIVDGGTIVATEVIAIGSPIGVGTGALTLEDSATVVARGINAGNGTLTVETASTLSAGGFNIGGVEGGAAAVLTISSGAQVIQTGTNVFEIGGFGGAATVDGGTLAVGIGGLAVGGMDSYGSLSVMNGGTLSTADLTVGGHVGGGTLNIESGGQVSVTSPGGISIDGGIVNIIGGTLNAGTDQVAVVNGIGTGGSDMTVASGGTLLAGDLSVGGVSSSSLIVGNGGLVNVVGSVGVGSALGVSAIDLSGGTLQAGGAVTLSSDNLGGDSGGAVQGFGTLFAGVSLAGGSITASGGTLEITGSIADSGTLNLAGGSTLLLDATPSATPTVSFANGAAETLVLANPGIASGANIFAAITGVAGGDEIAFGGGIAIDQIVYATGSNGQDVTLDVTENATNGTITLDNVQFTGAATGFVITTDTANGDAAIQAAPCFAAGTRIATTRGEVAVEDLNVGDLALTVLTRTAEPILWIGCRHVHCANHRRPKQVWPIRVAANAFGRGQPHTTLYLSPDHAIYIRNVLIPVKYLVNGTTITQVPIDRVTYHHIELPQHDVVLAEGLPTESYLDVKDRSDFANGPGPVRLYPDFATRMWEALGCAPLVVTGAELAAARRLVEGFASAPISASAHGRRRPQGASCFANKPTRPKRSR